MKNTIPRLLWTAIVVAGCTAGNGDGLNGSGRPVSEGEDIPLAATLASIQSNIFNPACIVCHSGANAPLGLRLDEANSFTSLVGVPSQQSGATLRVKPGQPDQSNLVHKLEGSAAQGSQMPLGGPFIPQSTIDFVRQWIVDGASAGSQAGIAAPRVVSLTPEPDSVLTAPPPRMVVGFSQDLDASTVNGLTIKLQRGNGDEIVALPPVKLSIINPRIAILDLAGVQLVGGLYRVTIRGSGANFILGTTGIALDGDTIATFELRSVDQ